MFLLLATACILLYIYATWTYDYWKKKKVPGPEPTPLFGNIKDVALCRVFPGECHQKIYWQYPEQKYVGIYQLRNPSLLIREPDLIKHVLVKDFEHFMDRGFHTDEDREPLTAHLVNLEGVRWRQLRAKLTPSFSSGKIRSMFPLLVECSELLLPSIKEQLDIDGTVEIREITARFTTDVIGSVAFGLQFDAMAGDSVFREMGRKVMQPSLGNALGRATRAFLPWLFDVMKMRTFPKEIHSFFTRVVKETMDHREATKYNRSDFLQLMIQLKKDDLESSDKNDSLAFNDSLIAAQAFIFFLAGFETSSTTLSFCLYELAFNPSCQDKALREITAVRSKYGSFTYEAVSELNYLELLLLETMRMYPPVSGLCRVCTKAYRLPGTEVTIDPGVALVIPIYSLHHDPKYFPSPEQFQPERFLDKEIVKSHYYMPFGEGPRICIGMRFAMVEMKLALAQILSGYKVYPCPKTIRPLSMDPKTFITAPVGGIWLNLSTRD